MSGEVISIYGAKSNNLKNLDLKIPRDKLVVITGLSGSGKSSFVKKEEASGIVEIKDVSTFSGPQILGEEFNHVEKSAIKDKTDSENIDSSSAVGEEQKSSAKGTPNEADEQESNASNENSDDLLDIPAFLRRQANW